MKESCWFLCLKKSAITFGEGSWGCSGRNYALIQRTENGAGVETVEHT